MMAKKINQYVAKWKRMGYPEDIPDEVPSELMNLGLAPSYKAICLAILNHDHALKSLGFTPKPSRYYMVLKKIELDSRKSPL